MTNAKNRIEKYKAKLDGDVRKRLYDTQKERMVKLETEATIDLVKIELEIKQMAQGQPIIHLPYYIIFGKEIYSKRKKFKSQTLINELGILDDKWEARGLDPTLLNQIKRFYVQDYPPLVVLSCFESSCFEDNCFT